MIRTDNLSYHYKHQKGIYTINLEVPEGSCFGLLGRNGAGKSTLMKLVLGLLRPASGKVCMAGQVVKSGLPTVAPLVGSLIESPPLYPHLTAQENLEVVCAYRGISKKRIQEVLKQVNLSEVAMQRVRSFSTGMKQCLGIALALLSQPRLLILDEPINGLDPEGIVMVRNLIRELHAQGVTILLSSHLLHEIEQNCDHVGILQEGRLLYAGTLRALRQKFVGLEGIWIYSPQADQAAKLLQQAGWPARCEADKIWLPLQNLAKTDQVIDYLRQHDVSIQQLLRPEVSLEDLYLRLTTQNHQRESL